MATFPLRRPLLASSIEGSDMLNQQGESLRRVDGNMLGCCSGGIACVEINSGKLPGQSNKLFAIPHRALHSDAADDCGRMYASKEAFEDVEGFDKDNWLRMRELKWESSAHELFNSTPCRD